MERMDQADERPTANPLGPDPMPGQRQSAPSGGQMATDPVCGTPVDPTTARFTANYGSPDGSWQTFVFCSDECKQLFEREPERYANLGYQTP